MEINISHQKPEVINHSEIDRWQRHLIRCKKSIDLLEKKKSRIEIIRVITVVLLFVSIALFYEKTMYIGSLGQWVVTILLIVLFVYLLRAHKKITKRTNFLKYFSAYYKGAIDRRKRTWGKLSTPEIQKSNTSHSPFAADAFNDLAVIGDQASLDKLFNMVHCTDAWEKWVGWVSKPCSASKMKTRQKSVKELMGKRILLLRYLHVSYIYKTTHEVRENLVQWLSSNKSHDSMPYLSIAAITLVILFWGVIIGVLFKIIPLWWLIIVCLANGVMTAVTLNKTDLLFDKTEGLKPIIESMQKRIEIIKNHSFNSEQLQNLQAPLLVSNNPAIKSLRSIQRLSLMAELRYSGIFYLLLQLTLLWNIHVYTGLSSWHRKHRKNILKSYESLTKIETLMGVACFSLENKEFTFPEQNDLGKDITFEGLSHPLLSYKQRIANNLYWSENKPMLLISGSNMAGKSTFMKAIGLNIMLSRLGAPICASEACFPMLEIKTIINVKDSLADGDSYFMSELKRLVSITQNKVINSEKGQPVFTLCLFDEIMSGTNSHDRTEIFKAIVKVLQRQNTFAIFSTHDMKLTDYAKNDQQFSLYEFSEKYNHVDNHFLMHFDYKLKEGVCHHTNAQMLLKVLGLNTPESEVIGSEGAANDYGE